MQKSIKKNYSHIIEMIANKQDCAFCTWYPEAANFEEAVPELKKLIHDKAVWRAVVVQDGETFGMAHIDKRNPFDGVGSVKVLQDFGEQQIFSMYEQLFEAEEEPEQTALDEFDGLVSESARLIGEYRNRKKQNYAQAVGQPLTRLSSWLFGTAMKAPYQPGKDWPKELLDDTLPIDREYYRLLDDNSVLASEIEQYHTFTYKYRALTENFELGAKMENKPDSMLVISERLGSHANDIFEKAWEQHEELEYDNFCDDNLYHEKMRFALYDVHYENEIRSPQDYFAFLSFAAVLAMNEVPRNSMKPFCVYNGSTSVDDDAAQNFFSYYLAKLEATRMLLENMKRRRLTERDEKNVTDDDAAKLFESDTRIPVIIRGNVAEKELFADCSKIGLATDCPRDEYTYWYDQMHEIMKKFIRYLREPRRAVKHAAHDDLRRLNETDDERALKLNEDQLENVQYRLNEEEQKMVETTTCALFKTREYTERLDKADKEVRRKISERMTKKKTVITGIVAAAAYLSGFAGLLFGNLMHPAARIVALIMIGCSLAVVIAAGFVYLFVLRRRLINRMRHFNYEMRGILDSIDSSLKAFSNYLTHACNVMREYSVFRMFERKEDKKLNAIKKHLYDIECRIHDVNEIYIGYCKPGRSVYFEAEPYNYDFTVPCEYEYDTPYDEKFSEIEFINKDNLIQMPIDYIKCVMLKREELYD